MMKLVCAYEYTKRKSGGGRTKETYCYYGTSPYLNQKCSQKYSSCPYKVMVEREVC